MCFPQKLKIKNADKYNWGGDIIVNDPVVKSFRKIPGTRKNYDIDVRDFLRTNGNSIIGHQLADIRTFADAITTYGTKPDELSGSEFFLSKKPGSFDFRANLIVNYLSESFVYKKKKKDPWLFPEETLSIKTGDCEDFAFLLASILISSGISSYNVRVALGNVQFYENSQKVGTPKGHAWVMYKQENSDWRVIEPTILAKPDEPVSTDVQVSLTKTIAPLVSEMEYIPQFVFNDDHLWVIDIDDTKCNYTQAKIKKDIFLKIRKRWNKLSPSFHGDIHQGIIKMAAENTEFYKGLTDHFRKAFIFFGSVVDDVDNPLINKYTPLEHFDNGYIKKSWARVADNIATFKADRANIFSLCKALHAVADFYAHSTYAHFAKPDGKGNVPFFDVETINTPIDGADYLVDKDFKDKWTTFSLNAKVFKDKDRKVAIESWKGTLISGRYAQVGEKKQRGGTFVERSLEALLSIPDELINDQSDVFSMRGALPHHNEIAVDEDQMSPFHLLYTADAYSLQIGKRKDLAIAHIKQILSTLNTVDLPPSTHV